MLDYLQNTAYSEWVRESWGWALALTVHAFGNGIVVGLNILIALRVLGLFQSIPYTSLNKLFPVIWTGVVLQFLSGGTLWMSKPGRYIGDGVFIVKFSLVIIGVITTIYFQRTIKAEASNWQVSGKPTSRGLRFAAAAVCVWAGVIIMGRLTAYLGALYI